MSNTPTLLSPGPAFDILGRGNFPHTGRPPSLPISWGLLARAFSPAAFFAATIKSLNYTMVPAEIGFRPSVAYDIFVSDTNYEEYL